MAESAVEVIRAKHVDRTELRQRLQRLVKRWPDIRERLEKQWNSIIEAWFPGGKDDPNLLMLRMDLGKAAIWSGELGLMTTAKMLLGQDITDDVKGGYAEASL